MNPNNLADPETKRQKNTQIKGTKGLKDQRVPRDYAFIHLIGCTILAWHCLFHHFQDYTLCHCLLNLDIQSETFYTYKNTNTQKLLVLLETYISCDTVHIVGPQQL